MDAINSKLKQYLGYLSPVPPPTERLCKQCTVDCVENAIHFLIECQKYTLLRLYREVITIDLISVTKISFKQVVAESLKVSFKNIHAYVTLF